MILLTWAFVGAVLLSLALNLWLTSRQIAHVSQRRDQVPAAFADRISAPTHRRAADYTVARARLSLISLGVTGAVLLVWTLLGGLDALNLAVRDALGADAGGLTYQITLIVAFVFIGALIDLPLELYATFVLEQRHGFNRTTWQLYLQDTLKGMALGALIGLPLLALVLWLMGAAGTSWWLWAWGAWTALQLMLLVIYPTLIAPWFNRFTPLADPALKDRVLALMQRCGFTAKGLYVMDGSRRSAHSNAYFTGLGAAKRVVFYDTLLARLQPDEVEAVLAHELGHFKRHHIVQRMMATFALSLAAFALLGYLSAQPGFYVALGVTPNLGAPNDALALLLFMLALPPFVTLLVPLAARWSRRHEFEADAYAAEHADARALASALVKLHEDNAATLTPDPLYVKFHYSHPPAAERIAALNLSSP